MTRSFYINPAYLFSRRCSSQAELDMNFKKDISLSDFTHKVFFFFLFCVGPKMLSPHWAFLLSSLNLINNGWNSHSLAGRDCLEKKKLGEPAAILPAPERRAGDRAALGRQLAPTFYSRLLGVTVWRHTQKHTYTHTHTNACKQHTLTNTSGEPLTYSPNHFIDLWAKDVKAYWGHH